MGSVADIRTALMTKYEDGALGLTTQYENTQITPPSESEWAQAFFMPNQPSAATLGSKGRDEVDGILQIDLNYPLGQGTAPAFSMAEKVRALFPRGTYAAYNGQQVTVRSCGYSQGRVVDSWYRVTVTIYWYAYLSL